MTIDPLTALPGRRDISVSWAAIKRLRADAPGLTPAEAAAYLRQLVGEGRRRPSPRHWMRHGRFASGSCFVYSHLEPDYCVVLRGGMIRELVIRGDTLPVAGTRPGRSPAEIPAFDWRKLELEPSLTGAA